MAVEAGVGEEGRGSILGGETDIWVGFVVSRCSYNCSGGFE